MENDWKICQALNITKTAKMNGIYMKMEIKYNEKSSGKEIQIKENK